MGLSGEWLGCGQLPSGVVTGSHDCAAGAADGGVGTTWFTSLADLEAASAILYDGRSLIGDGKWRKGVLPVQDTPEAERRLRDAVAECYAAFEKYHSKPDWVDAVVSGMTICPRKPAREFSPDEIEDHYLHATCFSGADREANHVQSTKCFLPRILEILSRPKRGGLGIVGQSEWLGEQWRLARWQDWQAEEREALEKWIDAWWYATLTVDLMGDLTKTLMCLPPNRNPIEVLPFALFSKDDPLLLWDNCGTVTAALQLAWMFVEWERSLQHGQLNGFGSGQEKVVVNWLLRKASRVRLERQFFNSDDALVQYWMSSGIEAFDRIIAAQQVLGIKGTEAG